MGRLAKRLYSAATLFVVIAFSGGMVHAAGAGLTAKVQSSDPLKPVLVLTNKSSATCQVANTAFGTISVTRLAQGGKVVTPQTMEVASDESPDVTLAARLKALKPGASVQVPLQVAAVGSGHVLESVAWAPETGLYGTEYAVAAGQPLDMDVTYAAPVTPASGAPMCGTASTTVAAATGLPHWFVAAASVVLAVVVVALVVWVFWRVKHRLRPRSGHVVAAAVVLVAGVSAAIVWRAPVASADYDVPGDTSTAFNDCMATFNAHRDVTGPILDALAGQHVEIVPNNTLTNDTVRYGEHYFRIYWDPTSLGTYAGHDPGSPPVVSYPCPRLFHEMYHAYDMLNGTFSRDDCAGSGIETKEVMATRAENALRQALGLPLRTHYGHNPLPSGSCTPPPPPSPSCSSAACGQSNGDPHVVTFDGLRYDFQAVGEFVAARDPAGGFEVQTRQQPFPGSHEVSVNTAVAMRVATDKVEVRVQQGKLVLILNGKAQALPTQATKLRGGGTLIPLTAQLTRVQWPDGSFATLEVIGSWGVHLTLDLAPARQGKLQGLLGNFNGNAKDDLVIRGTETTIQPKFDQIFPKFADSWRIDDKSSLFTYAKGASTKTYTDRSFPDKPASVEGLPGRAAAEALCRNFGVSDAGALADCTLDVALTGRPEFARAAMHGQYATFGGTQLEIDIHNPGDTGSAAFNAAAGQKVFVDVPHSTLPDQCGVIWLQAPDGSTVASGCVIDGNGYVDATVLPAAGTYHIVLDPSDNNTGNTALTLITDTDQTGEITPDGAAAQVVVSRPGAVARFSFNGQAGEKLFLNIPAATLPDQCGGLSIQDAAGNSLNSGCVIGGRGYIDTVQLPADGTYSVLVDPADRRVGQAAMQLIVVHDVNTSLSVDGPAKTAAISRPGSIATFTFSGSAGQRVYIDASNSTLPDQCGGFELRGTNGQSITSGCIIGGKGTMDEQGIVLPATGTYTVAVDPTEVNTGRVTVRVHH